MKGKTGRMGKRALMLFLVIAMLMGSSGAEAAVLPLQQTEAAASEPAETEEKTQTTAETGEKKPAEEPPETDEKQPEAEPTEAEEEQPAAEPAEADEEQPAAEGLEEPADDTDEESEETGSTEGEPEETAPPEAQLQITAAVSHVTVTFDCEEYTAGQAITATLTPEEGYLIDTESIAMTDAEGLEVELDITEPDEAGAVLVRFVAAESDMELAAAARQKHKVEIVCMDELEQPSSHLSAEVSPEILCEGTEVRITVTNTGDKLWEANVTTALEGAEVEFEMSEEAVLFSMPDADVKVLLYERESIEYGDLSGADLSIDGDWQGSTASTKKDNEPDVELGKSARWTDIEDGYAELTITERDTSDYSNTPVDYIIILDRTRTMSLNESTWEGGGASATFKNSNSPCINPNHYYYKGGISLQLLDYYTGRDVATGVWFDNLPSGAKFWNRHFNASRQNITPVYGNGCQDRLTMAKQGIRELVDLIAQHNEKVPASKNKSRVAFWSFAGDYERQTGDKRDQGLYNYVGLTENYSQVKTAVNNVQTYSGTYYKESFQEVCRIIRERNASDSRHKDVYTKVIFISDGMCGDSNLSEVRSLANQVKSLPNTELFTLAVGMTPDSEGTRFLKELATSSAHTASFWQNLSFSGGTGSAFAETLFHIEKKGGEVRAVRKILTDQIETAYWEPVSILNATGGIQNVRLNSSTGQLVWNIPEGPGTTYSCTVRLKLRDAYRYLLSDTSYPTNRDAKGTTPGEIQNTPTKAGAVVTYQIKGGIYHEEERKTGVITPKLKYGTVQFTGEKHWTVSGSRADSVTVRLLRTLPSQSQPIQVNNAVTNVTKNWRYEFTRRLMPDGSQKPLIKYDENGRVVRYEVTEGELEFYQPLNSIVTKKPAGSGGEVTETQLYNEPFKIKAQLKKVDKETGNPLRGALFSVYTWSEKRKAYVPYLGTTNQNASPYETGTMEGAGTGMTLSEGMRGAYITPSWLYYSSDNQGRFRIIETRAPEGYFGDFRDPAGVTAASTDADKRVYDFSISADRTKNKSTLTVSNQADGSFGDQRVLGRLTFLKKDLEGRDTISQGDATLAGATYRLYAAEDIMHQDGATGVLCPKDGEVRVRFVSSRDGVRTYRYDPQGTALMKTTKDAGIAIEGLEIGRYYLKEESASEGYLVDPKRYPFEIAYQGEKKAVVEVTDESVYEQVKKQAVSFYKVTGADNADKLEPMRGAKFSVYLLSELADGAYMHLPDEELPQAILDYYRDITTLGYEAFRSIRPATVYEEEDSLEVASGKLVKSLVYQDGTKHAADSGNEHAYLVAELEPDAKGVVTTPRLPYGRYLIVETTVPKNAIATRPIAVTITEDDEDAVTDGDGLGEKRSDTVILMDRPIMSLVRIVKYDTFRNRPVSKEGASYVIHDVEDAWFNYYTREMTTAQKAAYRLKYKDLVVQYSQGVWMGTREHPFTTRLMEEAADETCNVYIETPGKLPSGVYELEELQAPEGYILQGREGIIAKDVKETSAKNHTFYEREADGAWTAAPKGRARFAVSSEEARYEEETGAFVVLARQSNEPAVGKISVYAEGEKLVSAKQEGSTILSRLGNILQSFWSHLAGIFVKAEEEEGAVEKELTAYRDYVFHYEMRPVKGAQFEIRAAEDIDTPEGGNSSERIYARGELIATLTTDEDGKTWTGQEDWEGTDIAKGLPLGRYTVTQIKAGEGFALSEENAGPREIEIAYAGQEVPVIYRDTSYTNPRQRVRVSIAKQDAENDNPLAGAVFGLFAGEDILNHKGKVVVKADTLIATAETVIGEDGGIKEAVFAPDLPHSRYRVKELSAPAGYTLNEESIELDAFYEQDQRALLSLSQIVKNEPAEILDARVQVDETTIALTQAGDIYKSTVQVVKNNTRHPLEHFTLTDSLSEQAWPTELWTGTYNQDLTYSVEYQTNQDEKWQLWAEDLDTETNHHLEVPEGLTGEEEHIKAFRMCYGTVDGGFSREEAPVYMVKSRATAKGTIPNEIEVTGVQAGVTYRDEAETLTKLYLRSVSGVPAETEEEPAYEIVDTVETEEDKVKELQETVRKVRESQEPSVTEKIVEVVKVLSPKTGDLSEALANLAGMGLGVALSISILILYLIRKSHQNR